MAIIVSDTFNRADDPTGLGTADTGQVWTQVAGDVGAFQISGNTALWHWTGGMSNNNRIVLDTGFTDAITKVTLVNPSTLISVFGDGVGIICRYFSASYYWRLFYFRSSANTLRLQRIYAGIGTTVIDVGITLNDGDQIACAYCGGDFEIFVNDVSKGTYHDGTASPNYGTQCGLIAGPGTYWTTITNNFDNFLVETNGTCTPTYNCTVGACIDPGDGTGTYATLAACLEGCTVAASYNCVTNECVDPGDGSGTYASLADCVASGCGSASIEIPTLAFDSGTGSSYYLVAPVVDSNNETRSKVIKSGRVTSKRTNQSLQIYSYDVDGEISTSDLENGINSTTDVLSLTDNSNVSQSPRIQVNCPNAVLSTVRVEGDDRGETTRDRIDEIVLEVADQGVRR